MKSVNQVVPAVDDFSVTFQPSEFKIGNYEAMLDQTTAFAASFSDMAVSEDTLKAAKDARAQLNAFGKAVSARRIEIHDAYEKPYDDFKIKIDALLAGVDSASKSLGDRINTVTSGLKDARRVALTAAIEKLAPTYHLEPGDITPDNTWLAAAKYKKDGTPTLGLTKLIQAAMQSVSDHREKIKSEKLAIGALAGMMELEPEAWVQMIDDGLSLADVQTRMKEAVNARKLEAARKSHEAEAQAAIDAAKQVQVGDRVVDAETGEVIQDAEPIHQVGPEPTEVSVKRSFHAITYFCSDDELAELNLFATERGIQFQMGN